MATTVEQPYNLFAQQKQTGYPNAVQQRVPGQVVGETPEQFAAARQAANSQGSGYNAQPSLQKPSVQSQPSAVQTPRTVGVGSQYQNARTSISNADELARAMGYTSPEEEERLRKASVANQRIMAVADAIRHIGNIANTVNGAPSMKFNNPVKDEYDRYLKGKALRDAANYKYLSYQQQKAAQDAKQKQWDEQFKLKMADDARKDAINDARISRINAQNEKDSSNKAYWETRARLLEEGWPLDKAIKEARKAQIEESTRLTRIKANQGGFAPRRSGGGSSGNKYWDYDEDGNIHYYPNKTMWEQGVEEHSQNQDPNEQYPTGKKDWSGNEEKKTRKLTTVRKAGKNAYNAHNGSKVSRGERVGNRGSLLPNFNGNGGGGGKGSLLPR